MGIQSGKLLLFLFGLVSLVTLILSAMRTQGVERAITLSGAVKFFFVGLSGAGGLGLVRGFVRRRVGRGNGSGGCSTGFVGRGRYIKYMVKE
jgi:hypothetical protein